MNPSRIIITGDILQVRELDRLANPQIINLDLIHHLFGQPIESAIGVPCEAFFGSAQQRVKWYSELGVPFSPEGWAAIYDDLHDPALESRLQDIFADSMVIGFEIPPYLIKVLDKAGITFIDLCIHPIRYLTDYLFGIRSNGPNIMQRIEDSALPEKVFRDFARISLARSGRVYQKRDIVPGSALFLGQTEIDSTLVADGRIAGMDDVQMALIQLLADYPRVYYKFHPYRRECESVTRMISDMKRCQTIEVNIYDAFSVREIALFASLASGSLIEAEIFDRPTRRFLRKRQVQTRIGPLPDPEAAPPSIFSSEYWRYLILGDSHQNDFGLEPAVLPIPEQLLKFSLNMKWGR